MRLLAVVLLLLTAAASLHGRGAREDNTALIYADELIENKEYDRAVQVLSDFMKDNPSRFEDAQKRLRRIIHLRERYNEIANQLLDIIEDTPEDSSKILGLIDELLAIESPTNPTVVRFLDQIRYLAEFRVNSRRLEDIILAARYQLNQNNHAGALDTYASGLDIYQEMYFSSGYGEEAENVARAGLQNIYGNISSFNELARPISLRSDRFEAFGSPDAPSHAEAERLLSELSPFLEELTGIQDNYQQIISSFENQLAINKREFDESGDRSFLSFAGMLLSGPSGLREGMFGTLKRFWDFRLTPAESTLIALINRYYNLAHSSMLYRNYSSGISMFDSADLFVSTTMELTRKSSLFLGIGDTRNYMVYGEMVNEERVSNYLGLRLMNYGINHLRSIGNIAIRDQNIENTGFTALSSWQQGTLTAQAAVSQEINIRSSYQSLLNELGVINERINSELLNFRFFEENLSNIPGGIGDPQQPLDDARELAAALNARLKTLEYDSAIRRFTIATGDLQGRVNARQAEYNQGTALIQGITEDTGWGEVNVAYYPSEGLATLTRMTGNLEVDIRDLRILLAQFTEEDQETLVKDEMSRLYTLGRDLLARLLGIQATSVGLMATAREQVQRAASFRFEGDRLFQAAQAALNRNDFDGARLNLLRASEQYRASREIEESESIRVTWDNQVVVLNAEIDRRENEVIVQFVRDMVTTAQRQYFAGNIDQAETS